MNKSNFKIIRTDSSHPAFIALVKLLDAELAIRDGDDHDFYHQFNHINEIKNVVVVFKNEEAVACGAFKYYDTDKAEIKRMYTCEDKRGFGLAMMALAEVEKWANESGYKRVVLETGIQQPEAIGLYKKLGYTPMANYGPYAGVDTSLCFGKKLAKDGN